MDAIDCADTTKPAVLPAGYTLPDFEAPGLGELVGLCVPQMGMHAVTEADASSADPFAASMLVGYYGGAPAFFEPMISRDALLSRRAFDLAVPNVHGLPEGVRYPRAFRAAYDTRIAAYRLTFSGFGHD